MEIVRKMILIIWFTLCFNALYGQFINPTSPNNPTPAITSHNVITYKVMELQNEDNVNSVVISTYGVFYPEHEIRLKTLLFNERGDLVFQKNFRPRSGKWFSEFQYLYDKNGNLEKRIMVYANQEKKEINFYKNEILDSTQYYKEGGYAETLHYIRTENEEIRRFVSKQGSAYYTQCRKLDDQGNEIAYDEISSVDEPIEYQPTYSYEYENDRIIKQTHYNKRGVVDSKEVIEFDELNRVIKVSTNLISSNALTEFKYNKEGDIIAWKVSDDNPHALGENYEFEYKYDQFGNWIERKVKLNGKNSSVTKRDIQYF